MAYLGTYNPDLEIIWTSAAPQRRVRIYFALAPVERDVRSGYKTAASDTWKFYALDTYMYQVST